MNLPNQGRLMLDFIEMSLSAKLEKLERLSVKNTTDLADIRDSVRNALNGAQEIKRQTGNPTRKEQLIGGPISEDDIRFFKDMIHKVKTKAQTPSKTSHLMKEEKEMSNRSDHPEKIKDKKIIQSRKKSTISGIQSKSPIKNQSRRPSYVKKTPTKSPSKRKLNDIENKTIGKNSKSNKKTTHRKPINALKKKSTPNPKRESKRKAGTTMLSKNLSDRSTSSTNLKGSVSPEKQSQRLKNKSGCKVYVKLKNAEEGSTHFLSQDQTHNRVLSNEELIINTSQDSQNLKIFKPSANQTQDISHDSLAFSDDHIKKQTIDHLSQVNCAMTQSESSGTIKITQQLTEDNSDVVKATNLACMVEGRFHANHATPGINGKTGEDRQALTTCFDLMSPDPVSEFIAEENKLLGQVTIPVVENLNKKISPITLSIQESVQTESAKQVKTNQAKSPEKLVSKSKVASLFKENQENCAAAANRVTVADPSRPQQASLKGLIDSSSTVKCHKLYKQSPSNRSPLSQTSVFDSGNFSVRDLGLKLGQQAGVMLAENINNKPNQGLAHEFNECLKSDEFRYSEERPPTDKLLKEVNNLCHLSPPRSDFKCMESPCKRGILADIINSIQRENLRDTLNIELLKKHLENTLNVPRPIETEIIKIKKVVEKPLKPDLAPIEIQELDNTVFVRAARNKSSLNRNAERKEIAKRTWNFNS